MQRSRRSSLPLSKRASRRGLETHLGFESMEQRQVLSACPLGFAANSLIRNHAADGITTMATSGPSGYAPSAIRHAYGFDAVSFGSVAANGAGTTIAIVDAYDNPSIANDLKQFDLQFGLSDPPSFRKVNQSGGTTMPAADAGWASEIALDVEWAHAIAPGASILLVEANSNSMSDLMAAVNYARNAPGVVAISMSWGGGEFSGETTYDSYFTTPSGHAGVSFFASSGDTGAPGSYPSASPNVVSVGGTSLYLSSGNYSSESGWGGSGGGISSYESQPSYQKGIVTQSSTKRGNPDVAYDSDPNTGFPVYDSYNNGTTNPWSQYGGTSAAAPQWAALAAIVDQGRALAGLGSLDGRTQLLPALYAVAAADFHDVTTGKSTGSPSYSAAAGYDLVTGRGTPVANVLIADLVVWGTSTTTTTAPTAPTSFRGTAVSSTQVSLTWGDASGEDGYRLYQVSGSTATLIASYAAGTTSATVGGLSANTTYSFRLDAYNSVGTASASTQVTTLAASSLAAPSNVAAKAVSSTSAQLSWTGVSGAKGYNILWSDGTQTKTLGRVSSGATSAKITGLTAGSTNLFAVQAYNNTSTATSAWVSLTQPAAVLAPQGVAFTFSSGSSGQLSWNASSGAVGYMVYAIGSRGRSASAWVDADATSIAVSGLRQGDTYQFRVVAVGDDNSSAASDYVTFTIPRNSGISSNASAATGAAPGKAAGGCSAVDAAFAAFAVKPNSRRR
ncbi:MAG: fibronectin type III domain-containing protein [Planctomycetota bacterium]